MEQINADLNIQDTTALKRKANENDMKPQEPSSIHRKEMAKSHSRSFV